MDQGNPWSKVKMNLIFPKIVLLQVGPGILFAESIDL